jgi:ribosomal protein S18 acetylase RimI-like enzyme
VRIRPALTGDREFILGLAERLIEFGPVPGRESSQMVARDRAVLARTLEQPPADTGLFVAEDDEGTPLGFIHLTTAEDYYSDSDTGHIADVVVSAARGGRGIGSALMEYAEQWARERGFAMLTLNVFTANRRARDLYRRLGFQEEWIRCIKRLQP